MKRLPRADLDELCREIRDFLIESVTATGGHLSSNLGIVEVTVALHYVFDIGPEKDRLVFDVSHQSYVHKILTGRRHRFGTLRKTDGLCGFTSQYESPYDLFHVSHAGTAVSTALGSHLGRQHAKLPPGKAIALVGDAGIGAGMAFKALGKPAWKKDGVAVFAPTAVTGASLKSVLSGFLKKAKAGGYVAINAYLPRNSEMIDVLQKMRAAIRSKTGNAVTAGFGPRFQHSTGQFHKGGPKNALFLVITAGPEKDLDIPTEGLTFGTLIRAQAIGDYEALIEAKRKVIRIHLPSVRAVSLLVDALAD